jgi:universal stress protein E
MMNTDITPFKHLLVVLESDEDIDVPLARASRLCKLFSAKITVFVSYHRVMLDTKHRDLTDDLGFIVEQQHSAIKETLQKRNAVEFLDKIILSWKQKPSLAVSELIPSSDFDLIVKAPYQQDGFKKLFRNGLDHYFVSSCPLPLWMVKPRLWDNDIEVLACLDICNEDFDNQRLNKRILAISDKLARAMDAKMHVVDCYYGEIGSLRINYSNARGFKREASMKVQHIERLKLYIGGYALADDQLHFEEGIPDDTLPNKAAALTAEVTVIGNNEDTKYIDRLFSDTAQILTQAMPCDILVLKPES